MVLIVVAGRGAVVCVRGATSGRRRASILGALAVAGAVAVAVAVAHLAPRPGGPMYSLMSARSTNAASIAPCPRRGSHA